MISEELNLLLTLTIVAWGVISIGLRVFRAMRKSDTGCGSGCNSCGSTATKMPAGFVDVGQLARPESVRIPPPGGWTESDATSPATRQL